jgi:hypothetical protein
VSIIVQTDTPMEIPCRECDGDGWEVVHNHLCPPERDHCSHCSGPGLDFIDLACLGLNLSIAGALVASFMLGWQEHRQACHVDWIWWAPGCQRPAPPLEDVDVATNSR